jgi:hypothetical protein
MQAAAQREHCQQRQQISKTSLQHVVSVPSRLNPPPRRFLASECRAGSWRLAGGRSDASRLAASFVVLRWQKPFSTSDCQRGAQTHSEGLPVSSFGDAIVGYAAAQEHSCGDQILAVPGSSMDTQAIPRGDECQKSAGIGSRNTLRVATTLLLRVISGLISVMCLLHFARRRWGNIPFPALPIACRAALQQCLNRSRPDQIVYDFLFPYATKREHASYAFG